MNVSGLQTLRGLAADLFVTVFSSATRVAHPTSDLDKKILPLGQELGVSVLFGLLEPLPPGQFSTRSKWAGAGLLGVKTN